MNTENHVMRFPTMNPTINLPISSPIKRFVTIKARMNLTDLTIFHPIKDIATMHLITKHLINLTTLIIKRMISHHHIDQPSERK